MISIGNQTQDEIVFASPCKQGLIAPPSLLFESPLERKKERSKGERKWKIKMRKEGENGGKRREEENKKRKKRDDRNEVRRRDKR